jgi:hypothetical protein
VNLTGWSKGLDVTADGEGIVSHAGLALLRQLAGKTGLTGGLVAGAGLAAAADPRSRAGDGRPGVRDR